MDARIVAEPMEMNVSTGNEVRVLAAAPVDSLIVKIRSLFNPATVLAPLLSLSNTSLSAVAPDFITRGGVSGWAMA